MSEQLKKNFAKSRWKVNYLKFIASNRHKHKRYSFVSINFQQAYHATTVIRQMQRMALNSGGSSRNNTITRNDVEKQT